VTGAGHRPRPSPCALQALLGFVAAGLGWAFVAHSLVKSLERAGVSFVALRGTSIRLPISLAWPEGKLAAATRLVRDTAEAIA
jgi:DNA-binding transcriptional LysR family regulator